MAVVARSRSSNSRISTQIREAIFGSRFYHYTLLGRSPKALRFTPQPIWDGDKKRGEGILAGEFNLGHDQNIVSIDPWSVEIPSIEARATLHKFGWLRDVASSENSDLARRRAQVIVRDWISAHDRWSSLVWRADVVGERIANWLEHYDSFFAKAGKNFRAMLMQHLSQQLIHLSRVLNSELRDGSQFSAYKGLIYGAVCLPGSDKNLAALLLKLEREIERQIHSDGGQQERSPAVHHQCLRRLIEIRAVLISSQNTVPPALQNAIDRMAPLLRFYRHQDGGLGLFNGSRMEDAQQIDATLIKADARGQPPRRAPDTGFERLLSGRLLLLADTGGPPEKQFDHAAHAGTFSLEVSVGRERMIVNCGAAAPEESAWHAVQRTTAAHSTLSIEDRNSSELLESGGVGRRPQTVTCERTDDDESLTFRGSHDGYETTFGLNHSREVSLSKHEERIEGADTLEGDGSHPFAIRFHLHPDVTASIAQGGESVLLKLGKGGGWKFAMAGAAMRLDESIFLGQGHPRRTRQIVLEGNTTPGMTIVNWTIAPAA